MLGENDIEKNQSVQLLHVVINSLIREEIFEILLEMRISPKLVGIIKLTIQEICIQSDSFEDFETVKDLRKGLAV